MSAYIIHGETPPTETLTMVRLSLISEELDRAGIPSVLFGSAPALIYGIGWCSDAIDFVVGDDHLGRAVDTLLSAGYVPCRDTACQTARHSKDSCPAAHVHISGHSNKWVGLHKHSETLWRIPRLDPPVSETGPERDIMYASDDCFLLPMSSTLYPTRMPSCHRYYEAALLQTLQAERNAAKLGSGPRESSLEFYWAWAANLVVDDRYNAYKYQLHEELLPPSHRRWLRYLNTLEFGRKKPRAPLSIAWATLRRDSAREEAEFQATGTIVAKAK